mmetsp:Transcript_28978/g.68271  ORF Transcript_28978/g.68271 Transcript_28978/m.68271 type:complete len:257 (-) Transcript_28978:677-1447(-)
MTVLRMKPSPSAAVWCTREAASSTAPQFTRASTMHPRVTDDGLTAFSRMRFHVDQTCCRSRFWPWSLIIDPKVAALEPPLFLFRSEPSISMNLFATAGRLVRIAASMTCEQSASSTGSDSWSMRAKERSTSSATVSLVILLSRMEHAAFVMPKSVFFIQSTMRHIPSASSARTLSLSSSAIVTLLAERPCSFISLRRACASSRFPALSRDRSMMLNVTTSAFFSSFNRLKRSEAVSPAASPHWTILCSKAFCTSWC